MERLKAIDVLRAIAVVLVLGRHMPECPSESPWLIREFFGTWIRGGWVGVDLFFVLSGFLVSGLLFREHQRLGKIAARRFLIRRGFKIYPAFWVMILATVIEQTCREHSFRPDAIASELLFVQNYFPGLWNHTWSLAVEEHFYLLLIVFLKLISSRASGLRAFHSIPSIFLVIAMLCLAFRLVSPLFGCTSPLFPTHHRLDSLFWGVLISYFYHRYPRQFQRFGRRHRIALLVGGTALIAPAFIFSHRTTPFITTYGLTLFYVGGGCLLVGLLFTKARFRIVERFLAYVGSYSYSVYLWHMPFLLWVVPWFAKSVIGVEKWIIKIGIYLPGSVLFGILMARLIEIPVLRMRDRWFPSKANPLRVLSPSNSPD